VFRLLLLLLVVSCYAQAGDPTRPPAGVTKAAASSRSVGNTLAGLKLQQIVRRGDAVSVVISDKLYRPGDQVAGYTLVRVETNQVVLRDGQQNQLKLPLTKGVSGLVVYETE